MSRAADGIRATLPRNGIVKASDPVPRHPALAGRIVFLVETDQHLLVFDDHGTLITSTPGPTRNQIRRLRPAPRTATPHHLSVTDVLMQEVLPMS